MSFPNCACNCSSYWQTAGLSRRSHQASWNTYASVRWWPWWWKQGIYWYGALL